MFGLSLGLLSYYYGATSTVGVLFVLLVLSQLSEKGWRNATTEGARRAGEIDQLVAGGWRRILRASVNFRITPA